MKRILVADDDSSTRFLIQTVLKKHFDVTMAVDGAQAVDFLHSSSDWDCVVLDIIMPQMDGVEVLNVIKSTPSLCHIPVIMLTGSQEVRAQAMAMQGGAVTYFRKPFSPTQLIAIITATVKD